MQRRQRVWQRWVTIRGVMPGGQGMTTFPCPSSHVVDVSKLDGADVTFTVSSVQKAAGAGSTTPKMFLVSASGGAQFDLYQIDLSAFPISRTVSVLTRPGVLPDPSAPDTVQALGDLLSWRVEEPEDGDAASEWSITFSILITPRPYDRPIRFGTVPWRHGLDSGYITVNGASDVDSVMTALFAAIRTDNISALVLDLEVLHRDNAEVALVQTCDPASGFLQEIAGVTAVGRTSYLLTRDNGATAATMLRNLVMWEVLPSSAGAYRATFRILASPIGGSRAVQGR